MNRIKRILFHTGSILLALVPSVFIMLGFNAIVVTLLAAVAAIPLYFTLFIESQRMVEIGFSSISLIAFFHALFHGYGIVLSLALSVVAGMASFSATTISLAMSDSVEETKNYNFVQNFKEAFWNRPKRLFSNVKNVVRGMSFVSNVPEDTHVAPMATVNGAPQF